jgi:hypothetical protein
LYGLWCGQQRDDGDGLAAVRAVAQCGGFGPVFGVTVLVSSGVVVSRARRRPASARQRPEQ